MNFSSALRAMRDVLVDRPDVYLSRNDLTFQSH
jgi:hypothetical protein